MNISDSGKNTDYSRQDTTKGCHGQTAESQADTSKCKLTNTKLCEISQYPKQKLVEDKVYRYHHNNYGHTAKPLQQFELIITFGLNVIGRWFLLLNCSVKLRKNPSSNTKGISIYHKLFQIEYVKET